MSEFEQMMADINIPEEIAKQMADSTTNGEILEVWERMAPKIDESFGDCSTAAGICAVGMMLAYVGEELSKAVAFGKSAEDGGENVHPNFCIMAIALLAVNTVKASQAAREAANDGDGDGEENGKEKGEEKSH